MVIRGGSQAEKKSAIALLPEFFPAVSLLSFTKVTGGDEPAANREDRPWNTIFC
jgi:hypothetical protein